MVADLAPLAIAEGYEISFDSDAESLLVPGDAEALERAFVNLVRNAVQYGGGRGQISVSIEADGSVAVADQGCGIAGDKQSRIFEPFYRVSPHGSGAGLGLSMVNEIVTRHGGYVELSSARGKGQHICRTLAREACFPAVVGPSPAPTGQGVFIRRRWLSTAAIA